MTNPIYADLQGTFQNTFYIGGRNGVSLTNNNGTLQIPNISFSSPISLSSGGTGSSTAAGARINLGLGSAALNNSTDFASSGANSNITSLSGLSTPLSFSQGGTGLSSLTLGDILYASATDTLSTLSGNISTSKQFLSQTGTGSSSSSPSWSVLSATDITSGILPINYGGTGSATKNFVDISSAQTIGGLKTFTGGGITLSAGASNILTFNLNGINPPSFTTRSTGTKLLLRSSLNSSSSDWAIGIASGELWYSIPQEVNTFSHSWYAGTTEIMRLQGDTKLGIGTTTPGCTTQISGGLAISASTSAVSDPGSGNVSISGTLSIGNPLSISSGGTGSNNISDARTALGLGTAALNNTGDFASASHTHSTADITSGTFNIARLPVASSAVSNSTQIVRADDSRLSDSRSPIAHTQNWSTILSTPTTLSGYGITDAATQSALSIHITDVNNPHAVTKSQIGLNNVSNNLQLAASNNLSDLTNVLTAKQNLQLLHYSVVNLNSNYSLLSSDSDKLYNVNTSSGNITITLPLISSVRSSYKVTIQKANTDNNRVIINVSGSDTIVGGFTSDSLSQQTENITLVSDGVGVWYEPGKQVSTNKNNETILRENTKPGVLYPLSGTLTYFGSSTNNNIIVSGALRAFPFLAVRTGLTDLAYFSITAIGATTTSSFKFAIYSNTTSNNSPYPENLIATSDDLTGVAATGTRSVPLVASLVKDNLYWFCTNIINTAGTAAHTYRSGLVPALLGFGATTFTPLGGYTLAGISAATLYTYPSTFSNSATILDFSTNTMPTFALRYST